MYVMQAINSSMTLNNSFSLIYGTTRRNNVFPKTSLIQKVLNVQGEGQSLTSHMMP